MCSLGATDAITFGADDFCGLSHVMSSAQLALALSRDLARGRLKELPPPDARFRQKLSKVAEALKSGGSSKKWRKLDQVGERKKLQIFSLRLF